MGIFLHFTVSPGRIPEDQWERVYEEALRIVDRSNLLDRVVLERNGQRYTAGRKTAERDFAGDGPGVHICGTMDSGCDMESFYLFRRKPCCRRTADSEQGADIIFEDWYPEDPDIPAPPDTYTVWSGKTQGRPGHIPLLAIACLFADRFPEAVKISGDITAGQCRAAVRLANQYLERSIHTPVTCRAEDLIRRLRKSGIPVQKQILAFFRLYLDRLTSATGEALKRLFSAEALYQYFRERITQEELESAGFERELRDYLLMNLDLTDLLRMLVQDPSGSKLPLEKVLSKLFACQVHIPLDNKNCLDPLGLDTAVEGDAEEPHEIEALMGRAFFAMCAGRNRNLPVYLPLEKIRDACHQTFSDENTDALIDHLLTELKTDERQEQIYGNSDTSFLSQLQVKAEEHWKSTSAYDLWEPHDLRCWHLGLTIEPELEKNLLGIIKKSRLFPLHRNIKNFWL